MTPQLDQQFVARLIARRPLLELAAVLRSEANKIIWRWVAAVRAAVPSAADLPIPELRSHLPAVLQTLADVLESANGQGVDGFIRNSRSQGLARLQQRGDVHELMTETRVLRRILIEQAGAGLGRRMCEAEQVALNTALDLMMQQAVVAFIDEQKGQFRAVIEAELRYLSLLSHNPNNNNLGNVIVMLEWLRQRLETSTGVAAGVSMLDAAQQTISDTISGMHQPLQSQTFPSGKGRPKEGVLHLDQLASNAALTLAKKAKAKGIRILLEIPADVVIHHNAELIALIMQNLLANAVRFSPEGTIWVRAAVMTGHYLISVSDEGPGIAPEQMDRILNSSRQHGEARAQPGAGAGLAIASQATKLLHGKLSVESKMGVGSTFFLRLPEPGIPFTTSPHRSQTSSGK